MDSGDVSYQSSWDCFCKALIFLQIGSVTCFRNTGGVTQCKNKCWQYLSLFANHRYAACCCVGSIWNVLLWQHCAYDLRLRKRYSFGLKYLLGSPQTHLAIVQGLIKNAYFKCWNTASNCGHWLGSVLAWQRSCLRLWLYICRYVLYDMYRFKDISCLKRR